MSTIFNISDKIKLQGSEAPSLLNFYGGAAAAYSLRKLDAFYSGGAIRVRRSSDNTEQDVGFVNYDLDTPTLEGFVNENIVKRSTDFSSSTNNITETGLVLLENQSIGGSSGVLKVTTEATTDEHRVIIGGVETGGQTHRLQTRLYLPSGQSGQIIDGFRIENGGLEVVDTITTKDSWVNIDVTWNSSGNANVFIKFVDSSNNEIYLANATDVAYVDDITVTQLSADGFVTTWYDQSGNGNNVTQASASAQPKIVSLGSTILENGKPAVSLDGVSNYFDVSLGTLKEVFTSFVSTPNTGSQIIGGENGAFGYSRENSRHRVWKVNSSTVNFSDLIVLPLTELITIDYSDSSNYSKLYRDGSLIGTEASLNISGNTTYIGQNKSGGAYIFNGSIQEIVFYTINKSLVRTGIETNINDFYSIY